MNIHVPFTSEQLDFLDARIRSALTVYVREESLRAPTRVLQPGDSVTPAQAQALPPGSLVANDIETIEALQKDVEELRAQNQNLRECNRTAVSAETHQRVQDDLAEALADRKFLVEKVEDMLSTMRRIGKVST